MLKFHIVAKNKKNANAIKDTAVRLGMQPAKKSEFIISVGGDGTFLKAERDYPSIPKLLIRDSNVCQKCNNLEYDQVFMAVVGEEYSIVKHTKLEIYLNKKFYYAVNDFAIRNTLPTHAIRFVVSVDESEYPGMIGDGVVVATPFGSTGYFYSITRKTFKKGIGLAFNNITVPVKHRILKKESVIKIRLVRHDAHLSADNDPKVLTFKEKDTVTIKASKKFAQIIHPRPKRFYLPFRKHRKQ